MSSSGIGRDVHSFDVVHPADPLPTTASPILQGALRDGFEEGSQCRTDQSQLLSIGGRCLAASLLELRTHSIETDFWPDSEQLQLFKTLVVLLGGGWGGGGGGDW